MNNLTNTSVSQTLLDKISIWFLQTNRKAKGFKVFDSNPDNLVFEMEERAGIIFKLGKYDPDLMEKRFKNIEKGRKICQEHQLNLLKIPQAALFKVRINSKNHSLLAEEKVSIFPHASRQEQLYAESAEILNKAIDELARFILASGWSDVEWRNAPIINNEVDESGNLKIGLVDLEDFGDPQVGLFGGISRSGLVRLVNEEQAARIIEIAKASLQWTQEWADLSKEALEDRRRVIKNDNDLRAFHLRRGIHKGNELIDLDLSTIQPTHLVQPLQDVIEEMNEMLSAGEGEKSIKGHRSLIIHGESISRFHKGEISQAQWRKYRLKHYPNRLPGDEKDRFYVGLRESTIMGLCLNKLVEVGVLFKAEYTSRGWACQA